MDKLPPPIEAAKSEYDREKQSFRKLNRLIDCYEALMKFMAIIAIQDFYKNIDIVLENRSIDNDIRSKLTNQYGIGLGHWVELLKNALTGFANHQEKIFCSELFLFCYQRFDINLKFTNHFLENGESQRIIDLRNHLRHGATLSEDDSKSRLEEYSPVLQRLLEKANFLVNLPLTYIDDETLPKPKRFDFTIEKGYIAPPNFPNDKVIITKVFVYNAKTKHHLELSPLLIFAECKEHTPKWDLKLGYTKQPCGHSKFLYFNDLKRRDQLIFLDYWQGHHTLFYGLSLVEEFKNKFSRNDERKGDWFDDFINSNIENFVGRKNEIEILDRFVANSKKNILIVIGDPGIGKTTLLGKWAIQNDYIRHFFRENTDKWQDPVWFFENLSNQLSTKYKLDWSKPKDVNERTYENIFSDLLRKAAEKEDRQRKPLVFVIDGLDEAERFLQQSGLESNPRTILNWLPSADSIPSNVKIIISARRSSLKEKTIQLKYPLRIAERIELTAMSENNVRALLFKGYSRYEIIDHPEYIKQVWQKSEGNPLYIKFLLDDLISGDISFGDISKLPNGIYDYFNKALDDLRSRAKSIALENDVSRITDDKGKDIKTKCLEALAVFCLVKEPVSLKFVQNIINLDSEVLEQFSRYLQSVLSEPEDGLFTIFHSGFRNYLTNLEEYDFQGFNWFSDTLSSANKKILTWCKNWAVSQDPYALKHLIQHLSELPESKKEIYKLAKDAEFLTAQKSKLPNGITAMLQTIQFGLSTAITFNDAGQIVEFLFSYMDYSDNLKNTIPIDYIREDSIEQAISAADFFEPKISILWHLMISYKLITLNREQDAVRVLEAWHRKKIPTPILFNWLGELLDELIEHLLGKLLNEFTFQLFWDISRSNQTRIIRFLIDQDRLIDALTLVKSIDDIVFKYDAYGWIAIEQIRKGQSQPAFKTIMLIQDGGTRSKALKEVVETQIILDQKTSLLKIHSDLTTETIYIQIAEKFAKVGDLQAGLRTFKYYLHYLSSEKLDRLVENLAAKYLIQRDVKKIYAEIPNLADDDWKKRLVMGIAMHQCSQSNFLGALYTIQEFYNPPGPYSSEHYIKVDPYQIRDRKFMATILQAVEKNALDYSFDDHEVYVYEFVKQFEAETFEDMACINLVRILENYYNKNSIESQNELIDELIKAISEYTQKYNLDDVGQCINIFMDKYPEKQDDVLEIWIKVVSFHQEWIEKNHPIKFGFFDSALKNLYEYSKQVDSKNNRNLENYEKALIRIIATCDRINKFELAFELLADIKIDAMKKEGLYWYIFNTAKSIEWSDVSIFIETISKETGFSVDKADWAFRRIADYYLRNDQPDKALLLSRRFDFVDLEHKTLIDLGINNYLAGKFDEGINYFNLSVIPLLKLSIYKEDSDPDHPSFLLSDWIEYSYFYNVVTKITQKEFIFNFKKVLQEWRKIILDKSFGVELGDIEFRKASFLINLAELQAKLEFFHDSLETLDSTSLFILIIPDTYYQEQFLRRMAETYSQIGNIKAAKSTLNDLIKQIVSSSDKMKAKLNIDKENRYDDDFFFREQIQNRDEEVLRYSKILEELSQSTCEGNLKDLLSKYQTSDEILHDWDNYPCGLEKLDRWTDLELDHEIILFELTNWRYEWPDFSEDEVLSPERYFEVIIEISDFWAGKSQVSFAKQILQIMGNEFNKSTGFLNICKTQIRFGHYEDSLITADEIIENREEYLNIIIDELIKANAASDVINFLPRLASYKALSYKACGLLSDIFPDQLEDIIFSYRKHRPVIV